MGVDVSPYLQVSDVEVVATAHSPQGVGVEVTVTPFRHVVAGGADGATVSS